MRLLSRLLVVLVVCLVAIALPAVPAQANGAYITLSPDDGIPGEDVTVRGYNFTPERYVDIYYDGSRLDLYVDGTRRDDVRTDEDGYFRVDFEVPESYTGDHEVFAEDTEGKRAYTEFEVEPGLTVSPDEGTVGTTVTVEGLGFAEDEEDIELRYYLNGDHEVMEDDITADEDGSWQHSFKIPPSSKGNHRTDAKGRYSSFYEVEDATFEVIPAISLDRSSGSVGENITMTGSGFYADDSYIKILFAGEEAETEPEIIRAGENGNWTASFKVPERPKDTYSVTAEGERTRKEDISVLSFEIRAGLVLSPKEGHVGTNLTVTGHGFATNKNVVVKYDGSEVETVRTNAEGSFDIDFLVPESQNGARNVTAEVGGKTEAIATFTMESDAPETPELSSPPDGDRVGFIGKIRPTFEWSEVSDISGVYYILQIAASANVTATGFVDPIVTIQNIVATNYTLAKTEARPYGTYYWIVQAVDGAGNAGNWTVVGSFRAGVMPLWAFIVILVAVAGGIGTAVYFFVIRRRIYY